MIHKGSVIAYGTGQELKEKYEADNLRDLFTQLASERGDLVED